MRVGKQVFVCWKAARPNNTNEVQRGVFEGPLEQVVPLDLSPVPRIQPEGDAGPWGKLIPTG